MEEVKLLYTSLCMLFMHSYVCCFNSTDSIKWVHMHELYYRKNGVHRNQLQRLNFNTQREQDICNLESRQINN